MAANNDPDSPLDTNGVAKLCGCSPSHIRNLVRLKRFPAPAKLGALPRWDRKVVLAFIAANTGRARESGPTGDRAGVVVEVRG